MKEAVLDRDAEEWMISTEEVVPNHYSLFLEPHIPARYIRGRVEISVDVLQSTQIIQLHKLRIVVYQAFYVDETNKITDIEELSYDDELERVLLLFSSPLSPGKGTLKIVYSSSIENSDDRNGLFIKNGPGDDFREALVTQCEPCNARQVLPCWDQPTCKATFQLTLFIKENQQALSNSPIMVESIQEKDFEFFFEGVKTYFSGNDVESNGTVLFPKKIVFEKTLKMSTYSLAFVVDRFDTLRGEAVVPVYDEDGNIIQGKTQTTPIAVHSSPGRGGEARFVLKMTIASWEFFTNQFKTNNPLPKLDVVSIENLPVLGSENWGIITLITNFMLINSSTPFSRIQRIARLVCHEVVHQWFGNLVTMRWWNNLWIKEGMARYLEYVAIETLFPSWNFWSYFLRDIFKSTMEMDESTSTHPIEAKVRSPKEISHIFDLMSYGKGAAVARMIAFHVGEESFWKGVHLFLKKFSYNCASTEDLYKCFDQASGKNISSIMQDWVQCSGHPVISASYSPDSTLAINQEICFRNECGPVFLHSKKVKTASKLADSAATSYRVPIVIAELTKGNFFRTETILSEPNQQLKLAELSDDGYVLLNYRHSGFYRVCYDNFLLQRLENAIKSDQITLVELYGLLLDLLYLSHHRDVIISNKCIEASQHILTIDKLFNFIDRITQNCETAPFSSPCMQPIFWELIAKKLADTWSLVDPDHLDAYKLFTIKILNRIISRIGLWRQIRAQNEGDLKTEYAINDSEISWREIRGRMVTLLGACGGFSDDLQGQILSQFNSLFSNNDIVVNESVSAILQLGSQCGGIPAFNKLLDYVQLGTNAELKKACFVAMFASRDEEALEVLFTILENEPTATWLDEVVSHQVLKYNIEGRKYLWEMTLNYLLSSEKIASSHILGMIYVSGDAPTLSKADKMHFLQQLEKLNHSVSLIGFDRVFRPVVNNARENGEWARKNRKDMENFVMNQT